MSKSLSGLFGHGSGGAGTNTGNGSDGTGGGPPSGDGELPGEQPVSAPGDVGEVPSGPGNSEQGHPVDETKSSGRCDYEAARSVFEGKRLNIELARKYREMLMDMTAKDYKDVLERAGYANLRIEKSDRSGTSKTGWNVIIDPKTNRGARLNSVFVHHEPGLHGTPYIKYGTTDLGTVKIVDNRTLPYNGRGEKNTTIIPLNEDK